MIRRITILLTATVLVSSCTPDSEAEKTCEAMTRASTDDEVLSIYSDAVLNDGVSVNEMRDHCPNLVQWAQERLAQS